MILHPSIATDSGVKIPQTDSAYGAGFGDSITDDDRAWAATREPICNLLTYQIAADMTDKWFTIGDPDTEEADPALDRTVQDALTVLKCRTRFTETIESERIFGKSLLVGAFNDAQSIEDLKKPLKVGSELKQLSVYPSVQAEKKIKAFEVDIKDEKPNSPRFGEPVIYKLDRGAGEFLFIHYTRVYELKTRSNGASVLDVLWDDMTSGRNIRWGAGQWMYRNGSGFPVIEFPEGTTVDQIEAWANSGEFNNLMNRKYICIAQNSAVANNGMKFHFEGALGRALDPAPFFQTNDEQIAKGSGIPQPSLIGAQAGAVTGSEVNMQGKYKVVSREQVKIEGMLRWVVDRLAEAGQISLVASGTATDEKTKTRFEKLKQTFNRVFGDYRHKTAKTYVIEWNSAFELSELDEAQLHDLEAASNQKKLDYMTVDEVRAELGLDPLPNEEGAHMKQSGLNLFPPNQPGQKNPDGTPVKQNPQQAGLANADKFLVVDLNPKKGTKHAEGS